MVQKGAGKFVAVEAILQLPFYQLFAVLDLTSYAGVRFPGIVTPTTGTRIPIPRVGSTEAAI